MRKHYIDNLRWMAVLLLFPYHTFMVYNNFGEAYYIKGTELVLPSCFITVLWPWLMPLLFVIAGFSSACALQKRKPVQYLKERVLKLLVPLVCGILLIIPAMTYFAERFHNGYKGGYFAQYRLFFTKPTDLTGYYGGFTPGHLWFLLYLLLISLAALPIMAYSCEGNQKRVSSIEMPVLLMGFSIPLLMRPILNISGKSLGEYFVFFLLGYFVLSDDKILTKIEQYRWYMTALFVTGMVFIVLRFMLHFEIDSLLYDSLTEFYAWCAILALLGMGRHYLDFRTSITDYFSRTSFLVYLFHHLWVVAAAYYAFGLTQNWAVQIMIILITSIPLTFLSCEIVKRFAGTRLLFGL